MLPYIYPSHTRCPLLDLNRSFWIREKPNWIWIFLQGINKMINIYASGNVPGIDSFLANAKSRSITVCFTCARSVVFQHKIYFCIDIGRMVCFLYLWLCSTCISVKITHIDIRFVYIYFDLFMLSLSRCWTLSSFKTAHHGSSVRSGIYMKQ